MIYIIDGYNLLHAVGFAPQASAPKALFDSARNRFLDWLAGTQAVRHGDSLLHVIFDAQNAPVDLGSRNHRGIHVTFSYRQTADDVIEKLISTAKSRHEVCVVSNDGRLRDAAWHGGCQWLNCSDFLDSLDVKAGRHRHENMKAPPEKPDPMPADDDDLLRAFQRPK